MRKIMIPVMAVLLLVLLSAGIYSMITPKNELSYPSFMEAVENGHIKEVIINEEENTFYAIFRIRHQDIQS